MGIWKHCNLFIVILLCALCVGCAPQVQGHLPPPKESRIVGDKLEMDNGLTLPVRSWLPNKPVPDAAVIAVHGFNDYSNAFSRPGSYFAERGYAVYAYDQRGFGATEKRGIWPGEANLVADLKQMVLAVRKLHPGIPVYLLGESMGGAVVIVSLAKADFPMVEGAILSAPAVWGSRTMPLFYRAALWLGVHTVPWKQVTGKGLGIIPSDNFNMLVSLGRDPLVIKKTRLDAVYGIVNLMDNAYDQAQEVTVPLLLLYGMNDQIIPFRPLVEIADTLHTKYKLVYYPSGFHMLLRDLKAEVVMDDITAWMQHPNNFLPSGYDLNWRNFFNIPE